MHASPNIKLNPISAGGGVFRTPSHFEASQDQLNVLQISSNFLRIPIYLFTNKKSKENWIFLGGCPPFGPLKSEAPQKWPPMTAYNPYFSLQNPILL